MRRLAALFTAVVLAAFFLPSAVSGIIRLSEDRTEQREIPPGGGDAVTTGSFSQPFKISVYIKAEDRTEEMELEEYLAGVLASEVPPTYHREALAAQAVAARSFVLSRIADSLAGNIPQEHHGAMVCTDYSHCEAWRDMSEIKKNWDARFADDYEAKIRNAVSKTSGEYLIYDGKVAKAFFYAMSSGKTENAAEVWGSALPYLKSVPSRGDIGADGYESLCTYPKDLFVQKLKKLHDDVQAGQTDLMVGQTQRTEGGSVSEIEIWGVSFTGKELRDEFALRSANFEIEAEGDKISFRVKGYGHGVGMSQNGANEMAQDGKTYTEILKHYYSGVDIVNLYKKA